MKEKISSNSHSWSRKPTSQIPYYQKLFLYMNDLVQWRYFHMWCRKQIFGTNLAKTAAIWYINFSLLCVFVISYEGNEIGVDSKETQWRWLLNDKKFLLLEWAKHLSQVCFQTSCSCLLFLELVKLLWAKENNEWNFLLCLQRLKTF